jgi:RNA polymerase sigma-70 factor (ECF subfamily)
MTDDPDLDPILRARSGDTSAFEEIVIKYQPVLAAMLHRFAATPADLEDLVQESFVKAWQALPAWVPEQPFLHWLKRIAARTGLEYCRRRKRQPLVFTDRVPESIAAEATDDPANAALDEARALLAQLPADEQALLTLVHLHGMSMAEAAEHFGWSRAKAKIKAFRARLALRKILSRHGYDGT